VIRDSKEQAEKRVAEESARQARGQAQREIDSAREQAISKDQEKRGMRSG